MIDFKNGELLNMLPSPMASQIQQICISYALKQGVRLILNKADMTRTQAMIESLPERILYVLAGELSTPYYQEDMPLEKKRDIIKRTLLWHLTAGTPSAMRELIEIVIGEGIIVEWPDFDEPPYTPGTFDILTDVQITEEIVTQFIAIIERVKNERSHLRRLHLHRRSDAHWYIGAATRSEPHRTALNATKTEQKLQNQTYTAAGAISQPRIRIRKDVRELKVIQRVGVVLLPISKTVIPKESE